MSPRPGIGVAHPGGVLEVRRRHPQGEQGDDPRDEVDEQQREHRVAPGRRAPSACRPADVKGVGRCGRGLPRRLSQRHRSPPCTSQTYTPPTCVGAPKTAVSDGEQGSAPRDGRRAARWRRPVPCAQVLGGTRSTCVVGGPDGSTWPRRCPTATGSARSAWRRTGRPAAPLASGSDEVPRHDGEPPPGLRLPLQGPGVGDVRRWRGEHRAALVDPVAPGAVGEEGRQRRSAGRRRAGSARTGSSTRHAAAPRRRRAPPRRGRHTASRPGAPPRRRGRAGRRAPAPRRGRSGSAARSRAPARARAAPRGPGCRSTGRSGRPPPRARASRRGRRRPPRARTRGRRQQDDDDGCRGEQQRDAEERVLLGAVHRQRRRGPRVGADAAGGPAPQLGQVVARREGARSRRSSAGRELPPQRHRDDREADPRGRRPGRGSIRRSGSLTRARGRRRRRRRGRPRSAAGPPRR